MLALGVFLAAVLLVLIFFSLTRPETLYRYIGAKIPQTHLALAASQEKGNVVQGKPVPLMQITISIPTRTLPKSLYWSIERSVKS